MTFGYFICSVIGAITGLTIAAMCTVSANAGIMADNMEYKLALKKIIKLQYEAVGSCCTGCCEIIKIKDIAKEVLNERSEEFIK